MNDLDGSIRIETGAQVPATPAISIIIPNYNTAGYIAETLESVFAQTFSEHEVIVINDASPDSEMLAKVLEPFRERIVFIDKPMNEGTSATRNRAVGYARGGVISFLDADDIWQPTYLEELYGFMRETGFDLVYTDAETFWHGSDEKYHDFLHSNPPQGEVTRRMVIEGRCHILPSGTLIKKEAFLEVGGFDVGVARTEDFDLWMRLLFAGKRFGYLRKILFKFRLSPGSGSGDSIVRLQRTGDVWRILQKKLPFTDDENTIIERHIGEADAAVLRAKGRVLINDRKWAEARAVFREAARRARQLGLPLSHRMRMHATVFLLTVYPSLLWRLMRRRHSEELEMMPNVDAEH